MIKISVIIPVYKVPLKYLRACLDSLVAQTMQECEFIVVSDGAPETECSVCEEYATRDSRFKFFKHDHCGVSATRNFGIKQAKGEYITFVDSDDRITETFCEKIYNKAKEWNSDILLFEQVSQKKNNIFHYHLYKHDISIASPIQYRNMLTRLYFPKNNNGLILAGVCCKAYRRLFIQENNILFQTELHYSEDQYFCLNAFLKTNKISYLANSHFYIQVCRFNSASQTYKANYENEIYFYLESINNIAKMYSDLIPTELFYNRTIQCILYTLDKCIYRPDKNISTNQRKSTFLSFLNNPYCKESLINFNRHCFTLTEKIACHLCRKKAFWTLLLVSKKWHIQQFIESFKNY
ncbi:glycosyltransferase family 2 protein [Fibrobacter sp.]|uniref:glycosyltransferase family 2 protein n=1 Tax=Fibrobacter sp. TaxID=35828 RepID=UPI0025C39211|nr:glycosyltransferase family 2 protein [Fibrobacter sp.]MBR3071812.1 glycosyltransferase family 2 protein [Fibrobacter sp.]